METTLNKIRKHKPCEDGWKKLLTHLGKTKADDEPLAITTIIDSNGLNDAIWCLQAVEGHNREIRLYAVWCARQVQHILTDKLSLDVLDKAEQFANGSATQAELDDAAWAAAGAAWAAARDAAAGAAGDAAGAAARAARDAAAWAARDAAAWAAWDAAGAAGDAAGAAARAAARAARDAAAWAAWDAAGAAAADAARAAAWAAAWDAQEKQLRKVCAGCEVAV